MKKFEEQVKEAKVKKLQYRIIRDAIFIILGIVFLVLSIVSAQKDKTTTKENKTTAVTTTIKKTK